VQMVGNLHVCVLGSTHHTERRYHHSDQPRAPLTCKDTWVAACRYTPRPSAAYVGI
jgi:hypothetical protein